MPIYEFVCKKCAGITSMYFRPYNMHSVQEGSVKVKCKKCGSANTELIVSVDASKVNNPKSGNNLS